MIKACTIDSTKSGGIYYIRDRKTGRFVSDRDGNVTEFSFEEARRYLAGPVKYKPKITDIHNAGLKMPDTVYILGSGINGRQHYADIPASAYVVAVNKAVTIKGEFKVSAWVVLDPAVIKSDWYSSASKAFGGIRIFSSDPAELLDDPAKHFKFALASPCRGKWEPDPVGLRVGGTVGSAALEIAALCGAKHVILCGFDLSGDKYFDGTIVKDDRHADVWAARDIFDNTIAYYQGRGIEIETLSETKLTRPKPAVLKTFADIGTVTLPAVAYCCYTFDPIDRMNAIIDVINQDYPDELKTIYLMRQRNYAGNFPPRIKHNFPIKVKEIDVEGEWPDLWTLKLMAFCEAVSEPVTVWWDEDDRYRPDYTRKAIEPIIKGHPLCWNYDCAVIQNGMMWDYFYRSPIGTLVMRTPELKTAAARIYAVDYEAISNWRSPKRLRPEPVGGARDNTFKRHLESIYDPIMQHTGYKFYFIHGQSNTCGDRPNENNVDYKPDGDNTRLWRTTTK